MLLATRHLQAINVSSAICYRALQFKFWHYDKWRALRHHDELPAKSPWPQLHSRHDPTAVNAFRANEVK
jgi:hypothetical protein